MGKVIDMVPRLKDQRKHKREALPSFAEVVDLIEPRQAVLSEERREIRRTILTEFVGAFVVVPERGLLRVSLYDISDNGLAFELEADQGAFDSTDRVATRIYLNHKTYFEFVVEVKWQEKLEDAGLIRHGCSFVKDTVNEAALTHFVRFIEAVSVNLRADDGDLQISRGS